VFAAAVKNVDFARNEIVIREGKGNKDRVAVLPDCLKAELQAHFKRVRFLHEKDLAEGLGWVSPPDALARKFPNAEREWAWQWVFPSATRSRDPVTQRLGRHHTAETALQQAVKEAVRLARLTKPVSCHTLRHCFATQLLENGTTFARCRICPATSMRRRRRFTRMSCRSRGWAWKVRWMVEEIFNAQ
jgi:integrase